MGGIVGFGESAEYDNWSFKDNGWISFSGTHQSGEYYYSVWGAPWSFGYYVLDGLEAGLNVLYLKYNSWDDAYINLGFNATYYLDMKGIMPFIGAGFTLIDITDENSETAINASAGAAYAVTETIAPYLALNSQTVIDSGTQIDIDIGLKFIF